MQAKKRWKFGFQGAKQVNDTMLTKQVWRIIHDTYSLFYRLFKSKYFPIGNIFDAKQSSGSYARKSILKVRRGIVLGVKWRVGDGRSIRVFKDSWLPGNSGGKSHLPPLILAVRLICVVDLIDANLGWWNTRIIDAHFFPFEAQRI